MGYALFSFFSLYIGTVLYMYIYIMIFKIQLKSNLILCDDVFNPLDADLDNS